MYNVKAIRWDGDIQTVLTCLTKKTAITEMKKLKKNFLNKNHYIVWYVEIY